MAERKDLFAGRDPVNVVRAALDVLYSTEAGSDSAIRAHEAASDALNRLRGQRDYYRRRWLIYGIRHPLFVPRPESVKRAFSSARERDGDA